MRLPWLPILCLATAHLAGAQSSNQIRDGLWRGWLQEADQDSIRITMQISHSGKHILMTMQGRSGVTYDMDGVKLKDDVLTFDWALGLGSFLFCRMSRRNGASFEGTCNDRSPGEIGKPVRVWMLINPPDTT